MIFIYNFIIRCYGIGIWLASFFNEKANLWWTGRKNLFSKLERDFEKVEGEVVWIHCASLGEFEQGRPLIEALAKKKRRRILLTFYSPSGYEIRKNYANAHFIYYLPLDTLANAKRFLDIVQPKQIIFVKYELWYHFLRQAQMRAIPTYLIAATFRPQQYFFAWYGRFMLPILQGFTKIFVQDEHSKKILQKNGVSRVQVAGDTRVDRVVAIAQNPKILPLIQQFATNRKIMVCGSTWPKDEAILIPFINKFARADWRFIIAPHEIGAAHIAQISKELIVPFVLYSEATPTKVTDAQVLIIDNIGMLSASYQYADLAYIGGGFGKGIHNILEPIVFEIPVIFGPNFQKFTEARTLVESEGAYSITDAEHFESVFYALETPTTYQKATAANRQFIHHNQGATQTIMTEFTSPLSDTTHE